MKKLLILILIPFLMSTILSYGQDSAFIYDKSMVIYQPTDRLELDSVIWIINNNRYVKPWKVFYDTLFTKLAYESNIKNDTCRIIEYWKNGNIKSIILYINSPNDDPQKGLSPMWYYQELYCENGQLIRKEYPNNIEEQLITEFYCNGKLKLKFLKKGMGAVGKMESWYENGNRKTKWFWKNYNEDGEWKYYKISGELDYIENYNNGKLLNTIKK